MGRQFAFSDPVFKDGAFSANNAKIRAAGNAKKLLETPLDRVELAQIGLPYEKLDQLTMEVIMGIR